MKKRNKMLAVSLALTTLFLVGCSANQEASLDTIGAEEAKAVALQDAGIADEEVIFTSLEMDSRNGQKYYEIDFLAEGFEYEYDIDALTGVIIEGKKPVVSEAKNSDSNTNDSFTNNEPALIEEAAAKEISLAHAGIDGDEVTFVKCGLDWEDGRQIYEVEFYTANYVEYDYDIDALTGDVLDFDYDAEYYTPPAADYSAEESKNTSENSGKKEASSGWITEQQAKDFALAQVPGATIDHIRDFEVDYDDGRVAYEGTIVYEEMEYDFEIDGYSGAIREWDVESIYD